MTQKVGAKGRLRKVIQISTVVQGNKTKLTVLCDDESIWELESDKQNTDDWRCVPGVPQIKEGPTGRDRE